MSGMGPSGTSLEFPAEAVEPGHSWVVPMDKTMAMGGMVEVQQTAEITYRFESLELRNGARHAIISFSGPIDTAMVPDPSAPVAMDMSLQGEMSGKMEVDLDAGRIGATNVTSSVGGVMSMMGQDISMSMTMRMEQTPIG